MIVVFGATGSTGAHVVRGLLARGTRVRVAARDPDRAGALLGPGPEYVRADLLSGATLGPALAGARGAYVAVGGATGTPDLVAAESGLIDAARAAGLAHYVHISGVDAAVDAPAKIQRWHGAIEVHLEASGVPYTVLRPNFFMQNFLGLAPALRDGVLPAPARAARAAFIDARDIAACAVTVLTEPGHRDRRYTLTGPEPLSHLEVADQLGAVLGRPVRYADVPPEAFRKGGEAAGMPPWFAELLTDVYVEVLAAGRAASVTDDVRRLTGRGPRSLATFAQDHADLLRGR